MNVASVPNTTLFLSGVAEGVESAELRTTLCDVVEGIEPLIQHCHRPAGKPYAFLEMKTHEGAKVPYSKIPRFARRISDAPIMRPTLL